MVFLVLTGDFLIEILYLKAYLSLGWSNVRNGIKRALRLSKLIWILIKRVAPIKY